MHEPGQCIRKILPSSPLNTSSSKFIIQLDLMIGINGNLPSLGGLTDGLGCYDLPDASPLFPSHEMITS